MTVFVFQRFFLWRAFLAAVIFVLIAPMAAQAKQAKNSCAAEIAECEAAKQAKESECDDACQAKLRTACKNRITQKAKGAGDDRCSPTHANRALLPIFSFERYDDPPEDE